jgi:hypothetical protein
MQIAEAEARIVPQAGKIWSSGRMTGYSEVFLASADVRFFKQVTCPVWSKDKITQK